MQVREANGEDVERMVELFGQLGYPTAPEQVRKQLRALRHQQSGQAFVAEASARVVGIAIVHLIAPLHVAHAWALLSALVVDDSHRSAGVGSHLLEAAETFALAHGCAQLELSSSLARTRAHLFYERHGYQEKRRRFVKALS